MLGCAVKAWAALYEGLLVLLSQFGQRAAGASSLISSLLLARQDERRQLELTPTSTLC